MPDSLIGGSTIGNEVSYHPYPCGKPLAMEFRANFAAATEFEVNLQNALARKFIDACEALFVDNLDNAAVVDFVFTGTNQRIRVPASSQMYVPVLAPNPPRFTIATAGGGLVRFFVLNFPVPLQTWTP